MFAQAAFYAKALHLVLDGRVITPEIVRSDYDRLSPTYDDYFSRHVAKHSDHLLERMRISPGVRAADLACGTGAVTLQLARQAGPAGHVIGIDASAGMIEQARRKASGLRNAAPVEFRIGHMQKKLEEIPDGSLDVVTCAWAIGYARPPELVRTAAAKLRPGGKLGIIENRRSTLKPIRRTSIKVAASMPRSVRRIMDLHARLPRSVRALQGFAQAAGLTTKQAWEGDELFSFKSGEEVLDWVLHTGASAGFDRVMDESVRGLCDQRFIAVIERDYLRRGEIKVAHRYAAAIASRDAGR
ncbi:class I SAM-dependent methyltransferase [Verrucomicrobiota bacterium]